MDFWIWALSYIGVGAPVGLVTSRMSFKGDVTDPTAHKTYTTGEGYGEQTHTRTELQRLEACAASAVRWGWAGGVFWPLTLMGFFIENSFKVCKNVAGGRELADARREAQLAEINRKAAELTASLKKDWRKEFGPDAPD